MEKTQLRQQLAEYLGNEKYRKFVKQFNRAMELRFWQEQAWEQFIAIHSEHSIPLGDLLVALRICELHGTELLPDEVQVIDGCIDLAERYVRAQKELFPNANFGPVSTEGAPFPGPTIAVWYCPDCRKSAGDWQKHQNKSSLPSKLDLTRRTTLDEYAAAWGYDSLKGFGRDRWNALRAEVGKVLAEGGELWEWESVRFREMAGVCGLAVLKDGDVTKSWQLGRS